MSVVAFGVYKRKKKTFLVLPRHKKYIRRSMVPCFQLTMVEVPKSLTHKISN